jgi:hypothetical protein
MFVYLGASLVLMSIPPAYSQQMEDQPLKTSWIKPGLGFYWGYGGGSHRGGYKNMRDNIIGDEGTKGFFVVGYDAGLTAQLSWISILYGYNGRTNIRWTLDRDCATYSSSPGVTYTDCNTQPDEPSRKPKKKATSLSRRLVIYLDVFQFRDKGIMTNSDREENEYAQPNVRQTIFISPMFIFGTMLRFKHDPYIRTGDAQKYFGVGISFGARKYTKKSLETLRINLEMTRMVIPSEHLSMRIEQATGLSVPPIKVWSTMFMVTVSAEASRLLF